MIRSFYAALLLIACPAFAIDAPDAPLFSSEPRAPAGQALQILDNPGFRVGYSEQRRQPLWVAFRAASVKGRPRLGPRPEHFSPDSRLEHPVSSWDYLPRKKETTYTRGHLAPNYLIGKLYGREGQLATFLMSNVSPQAPRLNELAWQRIEESEVDIVAPALQELWVLTGPVFGDATRKIRRSGVAIPEAFYRIWLDLLPSGAPRTLAFLVPQDVCGNEPLSQFVTTVDEVEARTGLDFYAALDDSIENPMERSNSTDGWSFKRIDRRPPRYADKFDSLDCDRP